MVEIGLHSVNLWKFKDTLLLTLQLQVSIGDLWNSPKMLGILYQNKAQIFELRSIKILVTMTSYTSLGL